MRHTILIILLTLAAAASAQTDRQFIREGNRQYRSKQYEKAKAAALEKEKSRLAMVYHNVGVIMQNHQQYADAIEAYKQSLRNNPHDNETRYNLALCQQLLKNQPQQNKNQNQNQNKDQNKDKNKDQDKDKDKNDKDKNDKDKNDKQQQQPQQEQMSKENAEQLLNVAIQEEKATQQRINKAMQKSNRKSNQKNW